MRRFVLFLGVLGSVGLFGCSQPKKPDTSSIRGGVVTPTTARLTMSLTSTAFPSGGGLPMTATCDGSGTSPPLAWSGVPKSAVELVLVMQDPDAKPRAFLHWAVLGLDARRTELAEGYIPAGGRQVQNGAGRVGYAPACPPKGSPAHHYQFFLFALKEPEAVKAGGSLNDLRDALKGRVLAQGQLDATYRR